jgi:hypothetical protein
MSISEQTKQSKHSLGIFARIKRYQKNVEIIFDDEEPIGTPTDLVMPRRHWFRRNKISTANQT